MGNSGAKKTNRLLEQQRSTTNDFANQLRGYGSEDRSYQTGSRGKIDDAYWNLYNGLDDGSGGGGGGGGFTPTISDARMNEAMAFNRRAQDTGLYSQDDINNQRSLIGLNNAATFGGLRRQLDQGANIRGGGFAGYSGQRALLGRDQARAMEEARLKGELGMQDQIRQNMFRGNEGVGRYDTEFMNNQRMVENMRNAAGASAAGRASAGRDDEFRRKMSILGELRGLRGENGSDLPYLQLAGREYDSGLNAINSRAQETPWWQSALGTVGNLAGVAAPFLGGGGRRKQQGPTREELGAY